MFWSGFTAGLFVGASFGFILSGLFFTRIELARQKTPLSKHHDNLAADTFPDLLKPAGLRAEDLNVYN